MATPPLIKMDRSLRMPVDGDEAKAVYARWDRLNGRYYITAHVRLNDDCVYKNVIFDGAGMSLLRSMDGPLTISLSFSTSKYSGSW